MAQFLERNGTSILSDVVDPEGDPLTVVAINGNPALIDQPIPLSVGGAIIVGADGAVLFDDTGFTRPPPGQGVADSVIATVSDGTNDVDVTVSLDINVLL